MCSRLWQLVRLGYLPFLVHFVNSFLLRGSAIAKIVGTNTARSLDFHDEVNMWVHEETVDGKKLTDIINTQHENVKYLKGIRLPENVIAVPDLAKAAAGATLLIFVLPHQFVKDVCRQLRGLVDPSARAISLIKGLDASNGLTLISQVIRDNLQVDVSVLMGANVANDVANETFSETTIGYTDRATGELFAKLFHTPYFLVSIVNDVSGVELCGALKNIVAVAAGFVDGMGMGSNTKAAIMRIGMKEMKQFAETFYEGVQTQTFFESCGFADLITTCYGGRNARIAAEFVKTKKVHFVVEN